jgi:transcriptional regulator with XRE-family HTH domain
MNTLNHPHTRTFIKEWRKYRNLTQVQLRERIIMPSGEPMGQGHLSKLENGRLPYTQPILEQIAEALNCTPADLLMRDPSQEQMIWSLWETLTEVERKQTVKFIHAIHDEDKAA